MRLRRMRPGKRSPQLRAGLHVFLVWHAHKSLECLKSFLVLENLRLRSAFSPGLGIFENTRGRVNFLPYVLSHEGHFINDFLFVMKPPERGLELLVEALEICEQPLTLPALDGILAVSKNVIHLLVQLARLLYQPAQILEIPFTIVRKFVDYDTV